MKFHEKYTIQMIWSAMSKSGVAGLCFLSPGTKMNSARYVELLQDNMELQMQIHQYTIFMHDGVPCHQSKVIQNFWNRINVTTLDWPRNSPDLSPIEFSEEFPKPKLQNNNIHVMTH